MQEESNMFKFVILLMSIWILIYTASYGLWEYRNKNNLAAVGVGLLALFTAVLLISVLAF